MRLVSYFGNLYLDAFKVHLKEIKDKNFDTILFCISETDMLFNIKIFEEFVKECTNENIGYWAVFWGYNGVGESICKEGNIGKWLASVRLAGFREIMIDEAKTIEQIQDFTAYDSFFNFHLCLADNTFNEMSDYDVQNMPVKSLGVSSYMLSHTDPFKHINRTIKICKRLKSLRPDDCFIFIQGFGLPEGLEYLPASTQKVARDEGIENFGFWSFRGTCTGSIRSANPELIWENIKM